MIELPLPAGVERRVVRTNAGDVTTLTCAPQDGEGIPAVLVSGFFGTKEDYRELLPLLARAGYRGWAYDYPGQLNAQGQPDDYTIAAMAVQLREFIRTVAEDEPAHVVGHCLGGFVAREAVLADPGRARSLTLLSCGPSMREPKHKVMLGGLAMMLDKGGTITLWPIVKRLLAEDDAIMREFWHAKLATMNPNFVSGASQSMGEEPDRTAQLTQAGIPALVVHGKRDKRLWSHHAYADMARKLNAGLVVIDKAAHSPNMEQPAPTAQALLSFWDAA